MARKPPLYPHVPKSKQKAGTERPNIWPPFQQFLVDVQKAIHDEMDAYNLYRGMATTATALGLKPWAVTLEKMAEEEYKHHIYLEEILKEVERKRQELTPQAIRDIRVGDLVKSRVWMEGESYPWLTVLGGPYKTSWAGQPMNEYKVTNGLTENNVFEDTIFDHIAKHH